MRKRISARVLVRVARIFWSANVSCKFCFSSDSTIGTSPIFVQRESSVSRYRERAAVSEQKKAEDYCPGV